MKTVFYLKLIFLTTLVSLAQAAEAPLDLSNRFDLSKSAQKGETFFELMSKKNGIKAKLDSDYVSEITIIDFATFQENAAKFSGLEKLEKGIKGGEAGIEILLNSIAGKSLTPDKMWSTVIGALKKNDLFVSTNAGQQSRIAGALSPILGLMSGSGVLVSLDDENYCYNFGYAIGSGGTDPEQDKNDRRSGRSYGASISRDAYDPSDVDYLKELSSYVAAASNAELKKFYKTIFQILLKSDASGIKTLTEEGQLVVADFMAIYMAELDRHLMTGLKMYEWENALTEITMLAAYSASDDGKTFDPNGSVDSSAGRTTTNSSEIDAEKRMVGFFGVGTDGSGLDGRNKQTRHALTKQIVKSEREINPELVTQIENLIGARKGADIYDATMNSVNDYDTQENIKANADELIKLLVQFVLETRTNATPISESVL